MAQIDKPNTYFNPVLYTGNGSDGHAITGVGFQSDMTWIKQRSGTEDHCIFDVVRGSTERLSPNTTSASWDSSTNVQSFDSDGFTLGTSNQLNASSATQVSWNWKAGGTAVSNTDGSITSSVSANQTAGFSIVTYTGTESAATVGHGLGSAPKMIIAKQYSGAADWKVLPPVLGATRWLKLNTTDAAGTSAGNWNNTSPTSSVFSLGNDAGINGSGQSHVAYCFAEKKGFSKFGSYVGNGSADGTFCFTGMKPAFVMVKKSSASGGNWVTSDIARSDVPNANVNDQVLYPNLSNSEESSSGLSVDLVSNGFKVRGTGGDRNTSGATYIYMAFAENPLVGTNGVPATAR